MEAPSPGIYRRHEIPYVEHLMSYKEELIKDFLNYHTNWYDINDPLKDVHVNSFGGAAPGAWKASWFRYEWTPGGKSVINSSHLQNFPTAQKILNELEGQIGHLSYSIMEANSIITRHTGNENRTGEYLRIHIPLIVPEGDLFFEVNGEEITWDEPFGFNNQYAHSAYNYSNQRRLVLLIDIRRSFLGLPPCLPFNDKRHQEFMRSVPPFVRSEKKTQDK
jgi:hypothetical protein